MGRIRDGKCTPFLGAGACAGKLPIAQDLALQWAIKYDYPLLDRDDLARVAQFVAVEVDDLRPKEDLAEMWAESALPDFAAPDEIHGLLADLPLPIYITTNYDDFMVRALRSRRREPRQVICRWNRTGEAEVVSEFEHDPDFEPDVDHPLVYHFHGYKDVPESMVLTEDDYLDFMVAIAKDPNLLPPRIVKALAWTSLLFVGYSRTDWNFRVLFRSLIRTLGGSRRMQSVAVQLTPLAADASDVARRRAEEYLDRYFEKIQRIPVSVYWGTVDQFANQLRSRWEAGRTGTRPG